MLSLCLLIALGLSVEWHWSALSRSLLDEAKLAEVLQECTYCTPATNEHSVGLRLN